MQSDFLILITFCQIYRLDNMTCLSHAPWQHHHHHHPPRYERSAIELHLFQTVAYKIAFFTLYKKISGTSLTTHCGSFRRHTIWCSRQEPHRGIQGEIWSWSIRPENPDYIWKWQWRQVQCSNWRICNERNQITGKKYWKAIQSKLSFFLSIKCAKDLPLYVFLSKDIPVEMFKT